MDDHSFPAKVRIKSRLDFDRAFREGVVVADDMLVLHITLRFVPKNEPSSHRLSAPAARLGLSVSKRVGNAPTRNLWKRLIREAFRKHRHSFPPVDIVARPKKGAIANYQAIHASLPMLVARAARKLPVK